MVSLPVLLALLFLSRGEIEYNGRSIAHLIVYGKKRGLRGRGKNRKTQREREERKMKKWRESQRREKLREQ